MNSVVRVSTEDALQHSAVPFDVLVCLVAPRHIYFTIAALTVDGGSSSRAEI